MSRSQATAPRPPVSSPLLPTDPAVISGKENFSEPAELVDLALSVLAGKTAPAVTEPPAPAVPLPPAVAPASALNSVRETAGFIRPGISSNRLMQEAARLAKDGELGNSNAIRLLELPHTPDELKQVLRAFDDRLTREARAKLAREAFAPLPSGVENQRYEPIFDRYPISGTTYTTSRGAVVLNEVQYYNGEMVQLYGECTNVADVRGALAGSGYKPLTLKYPDGRETAAVQFWSHQLTDTSLRPYNAMFIIVVAVPEVASAEESSISADDSGASSVLPMFSGTFSPELRLYTNRLRLYYHRLLDSTQVAIDFGRERMGTDKRPGIIDRARSGSALVFSVRDGLGRGVAKIEAILTEQANACGAMLTRAALTAGFSLPELPLGTECVYPSIARIGSRPVVLWDWRTDVQPRLQPVTATTMRIDPSSDEGATLIRWGFRASILGHLPNVRGVVTGLPDSGSAK